MISLATDFACGGYGHFVHDALPRLRLLRLAGIDVSAADWVFFPHLETLSTRAIRQALGLDGRNVLHREPECDYACERLIATTYPHAVGAIAPRDALFLARLGDAWRPPVRTPDRRVFLSRSGSSRNFLNETDVHCVLRRHGFEIVAPAEGSAALAACADATVLVGIDGANMANISFAPLDARVLLIYPDSPPPLPYMLTLAASAGRRVHVVAGKPDGTRRRPYVADFQMDLALLDQALTAICANAG